jgi:hypothetical protein
MSILAFIDLSVRKEEQQKKESLIFDRRLISKRYLGCTKYKYRLICCTRDKYSREESFKMDSLHTVIKKKSLCINTSFLLIFGRFGQRKIKIQSAFTLLWTCCITQFRFSLEGFYTSLEMFDGGSLYFVRI